MQARGRGFCDRYVPSKKFRTFPLLEPFNNTLNKAIENSMNIDISTHQLQEATAKALEKEKVTLDDVINAWHAVGLLVKQQLFLGKGVRITAFGTFSIIGGKEPLFQMATDFGRQNSLKQIALTGTPDNIPITSLNYASLGEMLEKPRDVMEKIITKMMYNLGSQIRSGRTVLLTLHRCCEITIGKNELRCDFTPEFVAEVKQGGPKPPTPAKKSNAVGGSQQRSSSAQLQRQRGQQPLRRPDSRETLASPRGFYQQRPGTAAAGESYSYGSAKPGSAAREGQLRRENLERLQNQQARELASERPRPMYARRPQTAGDERDRARPGSAGFGGAVGIQDRAQFFRAGEGTMPIYSLNAHLLSPLSPLLPSHSSRIPLSYSLHYTFVLTFYL